MNGGMAVKKRLSVIIAMTFIMVLSFSSVSSAFFFNRYTDEKVLKSFELNDFGIMTIEYSSGKTEGLELAAPTGNILTDYESYIMGAVALGHDTTNAQLNITSSQRQDGKFSDYVGGEGEDLVNVHVWGIISLYSAANEGYDREMALSWLLGVQNEDGGFPVYKGMYSDVDMTYMAVVAMNMLGKSSDSDEIQNALEYCEKAQVIKKSCESKSWEIIAKDFLGVKLEKAVLEELEKYRLKNGTYRHTMVSQKGNYMATWHGILAKNSSDKEGNVFDHLRNKSLLKKEIEKNKYIWRYGE